jgi:uncharacterized protein (DUF488 family)
VATRIWTVGHSIRTVSDLLTILQIVPIQHVVDVRTVPRSRRNPQFDRDALAWELQQAGVEYTHARALGGLRKPIADSINTAFHHEGFRGYADHMQTAPFRDGLERLIAEAQRCATTVMCAEASPWDCHRSLLADGLSAKGVDVSHLLDAERLEPHRLNPLARVQDQAVTYPGLL